MIEDHEILSDDEPAGPFTAFGVPLHPPGGYWTQDRDNRLMAYIQTGEQPAKGHDIPLGFFTSPQAARLACEAVNDRYVIEARMAEMEELLKRLLTAFPPNTVQHAEITQFLWAGEAYGPGRGSDVQA